MVIPQEFKSFSFDQTQIEQLQAYAALLLEWNEKINLISRKDTEDVMQRHILHSLGVHSIKKIKPGFSVLDVGTGGGLPGIPLAIANPLNPFTLVDSIGKKITATAAMVESLGLQNVTCINARVETLPQPFDIITGRAVTRLQGFYMMTRSKLMSGGSYLLLKGGELKGELGKEIKEFEKSAGMRVKSYALQEKFNDPFFETKFVLEIRKKR
jgi:16S rRNA (guanine527-N7)-methyltransferase